MKEYKFTKKLPKESTSFRLIPEAKRQLEKEAEEYGLTLSDYIAQLVVNVRAENEEYKERIRVLSEILNTSEEKSALYKSLSEKYKEETKILKQELEELNKNSIHLNQLHQVAKEKLEQLQQEYPNRTKEEIMGGCINKSIEIEKNKLNEIFHIKEHTLVGYFPE